MSVFYIPESALAIFAHPDDIEFSCAGTLARWAREGCRVGYVLCTSGEAGIDDLRLSSEQAAALREEEQREAARVVGAREVIFLRHPDGLLQPTLELRRQLVREIRRFKPEVVVCGDPTVVWAGNDYINHPDHRAAALAALEAVFPAAGQPRLFADLAEEGLMAHKTRKVYASVWEGADLFVNIEETIEVKIEALRAHKSQMRGWDPAETLRKWAAEAARGKEMAYAEGFRVVTLVDDETWERNRSVWGEATRHAQPT